jgi:SAM-dependent methyltransferase
VHSNWSVPQKDSWVKKSARVAAFDQRPRVLHVDDGRESIFGWLNAGELGFDPAHARTQRLPLPDDGLDGIHLSHVLERVTDAQPLFDELWRAARPGARLVVRVAHGAHAPVDGRIADRAWYEGSFAHLAAPAAGHVGRADWLTEELRCIDGPDGTPREVIAVLRAVKPARASAHTHPTPPPSARHVHDPRFDPAFAAAHRAAAPNRTELESA